MTTLRGFLLSSLLLVGVARSSPAPDPNVPQSIPPAVATEDLERAIETPFHLGTPMNRFASEIYDVLAGENSGNLVLSPYSIHIVMSMVYYGSPETSTTYRELQQALGMSTRHNGEYPYNFLRLLSVYEHVASQQKIDIRLANKIYSDDTFAPKEDYLSFLGRFFKTTLEQLDIGRNPRRATQVINRYVEGKTNGLIPQLLSSGDIDSFTRMVLINAIYFKANWKYQFKPKDTHSKPFHVKPGVTILHRDTMHQQAVLGVASVHELDAQVLEMPYELASFRMLIVLPNRSIQDLDRRLVNFDLNGLDDRRFNYGPTALQLPRFEASFRAQLVDTLIKLGVHSVFDDLRANLTDITEAEEISVKNVVHMAKIKVTEEGSEAAAATAAAIGTRAANSDIRMRDFIVDRPFFFVIQDRHHRIPLFTGRVIDPSGQHTLDGKQDKREVALAPSPAQAFLDTIGNRQQDRIPASLTAKKQEEQSEEIGHRSEDESPLSGQQPADNPDCDEQGYRGVDETHSISFPCRQNEAANNE